MLRILLNKVIYKVKFKQTIIKYYLFGIPFYKKKYHKKDDLENLDLSAKKFHRFNTNDECLLAKLKNMGDFTYIPNPGNMGDMLIAAATLQFFDRNHLSYTMINSSKKLNTIVYGGGGIWTKDYQDYWLKLLQYFKNAEKVLILPSSFCQCDEFIKCLDERFTVFCREQQSYNYLKNANTKAEIILDHDMAFRLDTSIFKYKDFVLNFDAFRALNNLCSFLLKTPNTFNVAYFLRKDCEKAYDYPSDMDLSNLIGGNEFSSREHIMLCAILMLCIVDKFNAVVTDRLHVGIASVLMGKTVYLLDNSYKKLSSVYNHSLKNNKNVHFVTALPLNITASQTTSNNLIKLFNVIGHIYKIPRFIFL